MSRRNCAAPTPPSHIPPPSTTSRSSASRPSSSCRSINSSTTAIWSARGLRNYWGYNSIGYFAPHAEYAAGDHGEQVVEFKRMVRALHAAGIEVILDVVYNHTAEGNHLGPMLSLKGLDNAAYYRTVDADRRFYMDYTGTGNSLNMRHPHSLQLVMDSLRYWTLEMHVDGFRFDLAAALARELYDVDRLSAFFDIIHQDPVLNRVKLIAEPWDVGIGGYQVGNFPVLWCEWNGKYRDIARDYWRSQEATLGEFAARLTGSADLYQDDGRKPYASINFVTAHDGFTLRDLVLVQRQAQRRQRRRQSRRREPQSVLEPRASKGRPTIRRSTRCVPVSSAICSRRCCSRRACRCCSAATRSGARSSATTTRTARTTRSRGTTGTRPMRGCSTFTRRLIAFRRLHPVFRRRRLVQRAVRRRQGRRRHRLVQAGRRGDVRAGLGRMVRQELRRVPERRRAAASATKTGASMRDDSFLLLFNAHVDVVTFTLPELSWGRRWSPIIDTVDPEMGSSNGRRSSTAGDVARAARPVAARAAARLTDVSRIPSSPSSAGVSGNRARHRRRSWWSTSTARFIAAHLLELSRAPPAAPAPV